MYGAFIITWIIIPVFLTSIGSMTTDIIGETCMGRLQELFNSKRNDFFGIFGCIPVAAGDDGVLLYKNCLRTKTQGNCYLKSIEINLLLIALLIDIAPDK